MHRKPWWPILAILLFLITGPGSAAAARVRVVVSIPPLKFFVSHIGGNGVAVTVMVPPGASPATYEPKPRQMVMLSRADLYIAIGVPFERAWLGKIAAANPRMRVVHADAGIEKMPMARHFDPEGNAPVRSDPGHAADPHIWLAPPLVKIQARHISDALASVDPTHKDVYAANLNRFLGLVNRVDARLRKTLAGRNGSSFLVFHPSWGYFARAYGLHQLPIELEGKSPKPAELLQIIEFARARHIRAVFVQPQFSTRSAALVAREIHGRVIFIDPLAENWDQNLLTVAARLGDALR